MTIYDGQTVYQIDGLNAQISSPETLIAVREFTETEDGIQYEVPYKFAYIKDGKVSSKFSFKLVEGSDNELTSHFDGEGDEVGILTEDYLYPAQGTLLAYFNERNLITSWTYNNFFGYPIRELIPNNAPVFFNGNGSITGNSLQRVVGLGASSSTCNGSLRKPVIKTSNLKVVKTLRQAKPFKSFLEGL